MIAQDVIEGEATQAIYEAWFTNASPDPSHFKSDCSDGGRVGGSEDTATRKMRWHT